MKLPPGMDRFIDAAESFLRNPYRSDSYLGHSACRIVIDHSRHSYPIIYGIFIKSIVRIDLLYNAEIAKKRPKKTDSEIGGIRYYAIPANEFNQSRYHDYIHANEVRRPYPLEASAEQERNLLITALRTEYAATTTAARGIRNRLRVSDIRATERELTAIILRRTGQKYKNRLQ